jgi:hypothetical protein
VALYPTAPDGQHRPHALHVLSLAARSVARILSFQDIDALRRFDIPHVLSTDARGWRELKQSAITKSAGQRKLSPSTFHR